MTAAWWRGLLVALLLMVVGVSPGAAQARDTVRTRRDTLRTRSDTLRRPAAPRDTSRVRADSLKARADSARPAAPADTLKTRADSLRADSLRVAAARQALADSLTKAREDSVRSDSLMREDLAIIAEQKRRADSIKAPTPGAEMPVLTEHGGVLRWNRDQLGASGALTLGDLLESVPGLTVFRSGWIGSPEQAAFLGDFSTVRVFQDGVELDVLDRRNGGVLDLSMIQIWQLEEVRVERGAFEVKVYLRSWRVRSTTPATRVDIGTGDLQTNGYRGYFGRRFDGGQALQVGGYQFSSRDRRTLGDADQLSLFARTGWARGRFSWDLSWLRTRRERTQQVREEGIGSGNLTPLDATNSDFMARVAFTDTAKGVWAQLSATTQVHEQSARVEDNGGLSTTPTDTTADSTAFRADRRQYVAAAGWARGALSLSGTLRVREVIGEYTLSPMLRASWEQRRLVVSGTAERRGDLDFTRLEASARYQPLSFLALTGAVGRTTFGGDSTTGSPLAFRGEGAVRLSRLWAGGGFLRRNGVRLGAPVVFDTGFRGGIDQAASAVFVTARGKFWKDVGMDVVGVKWQSAGPFRPTYQTRSRLYVDTSWPSRFPSGNLNILFAVSHEYRTQAAFPWLEETLQSSQYRTLGFILEIRLLQATISYQFRNFLNEEYAQVPGFLNPRPVQVYGVRWNFFN